LLAVLIEYQKLELARLGKKIAQSNNWGEPERAPH